MRYIPKETMVYEIYTHFCMVYEIYVVIIKYKKVLKTSRVSYVKEDRASV